MLAGPHHLLEALVIACVPLLLVAALLAPVHDPAPVAPPPGPPAEPLTPARQAELVDAVRAYEADARALVRTALAEGRAYERLVELVEAAPHRLAGSPGGAAAVEWARQAMLELGLENVRLEPVQAVHWERGDVGRVTLVEPPEFAGEELPMLALGGSVATPEHGLVAEVVVVDSVDACRELGEEARGKLVLFNGRFDPGLVHTFSGYGDAVRQRSRGPSAAASMGAVGALVRSITPNLDDVPHTGGLSYASDQPKIPAAAISTNAAARIAALVDAGRTVKVHFAQNPRSFPDVPTFNVVGELVGREKPEQVVVVGGHLDAWDVGQGAHDDGAGCVHALEAARLLQAFGPPRRTLRVVLYANEENGLRGGTTYVREHADELEQHLMALESDSGGFTPRGFETNASAEANPGARLVLETVAELLAFAGAGTILDGGGGADIGPLRPHGVVTVGYEPDSQRYFDLHHTHEDTLDKVSPRELHLGAGVIAALLRVVTDMEPDLPRNPTEG